METTQLQSVLRNLDNSAKRISNQIMEINSQIRSLYLEAENYRNTAESILDRVSYEDDAGRSADMVSQASAYISRAEYCESSAASKQLQADSMKEELRGFRSEYEYYMNEGETNIENLKLMAEKLTAMPEVKYGRDKILQTLKQTRQRLEFNQKLIDGCRQRINWIDQICGSEGSQPVKKYTLHR